MGSRHGGSRQYYWTMHALIDWLTKRASAPPVPSVAEKGNDGRPRMPVRLVLADDHLVLRQALRALLERRGLEVVADEADGAAAVNAVRRLAPDVAVLDVAMPVLNGVDAAREIARIAPSCAVILLSGVDDTRFVRQALRQPRRLTGHRGGVRDTRGG